MLILLATSLSVATTAQARDDDPAADPVLEQESINPSLEPLAEEPNLETPQATVEHFLLSCHEDDFSRAARSLNFRLLGPVTEEEAAVLAERLYFVLNQELWIDWNALPDRADGMDDRPSLTGRQPMAGLARRSIRIGEIEVDGRSAPVRVERVRAPGEEPRWLFGAQTVANVEAWYGEHGPGWLDRRMPEWARVRGWGRVFLWKWIVLGAGLVVAPAAGFLASWLVKWILARTLPYGTRFFSPFDWPLAALVTSLLLWALLKWGLSLPSAIAMVTDPLALIAVVGSVTWLIMRTVSFLIENFAKGAVRQFHEDDSSRRRQILMQITVARHVLMLVVAVGAIGVVMLQLDTFRTLGMALLSSAGAAAVILGIAGHAVLGNLIAGLQIALTRPFTFGDTVYIEDNWGTIEDITYTYVVVRTWDERRLVLPVKYFIDNWFENWSMTDAFLVKPIYLHVDYRADVERIRARFMELLEEDERWDGDRDEPSVLVTEAEEETMKVRLTCGGATPGDAWVLHCHVRERLIAWLQGVDGGAWLPRRRVLLGSPGDGAGAETDGAQKDGRRSHASDRGGTASISGS